MDPLVTLGEKIELTMAWPDPIPTALPKLRVWTIDYSDGE